MGITDLGVQKHFAKRILSKIRLLQTIAFISIFILTCIAINNYRLGDSFSSYILESFAVLVLGSIFLSHKGRLKLATSYLFTLISFAIFYFDSYSSTAAGFYLYYFSLLLAIANIFNFKTKQDRIIAIAHLGLIGLLVGISIATDNQLFSVKDLSENQIDKMFFLNLVLSIASVGYFTYLMIGMNTIQADLYQELVDEEIKLRISEIEKNRNTEILLAELHHRLKNNLSLMNSLLKLKLETTNESNYSIKVTETIHAIQTVAQANRNFVFEKENLSLPMAPFAKEIILYWNQLTDHKGNIHINASDFKMNIKDAIPLGLIIHEFILLFWEIAIQQTEEEKLDFKIRKGNLISLKISSSIPDLLEFDVNRKNIIEALAEQIDATITQLNPNDIAIEMASLKVQPLLESEVLFRENTLV